MRFRWAEASPFWSEARDCCTAFCGRQHTTSCAGLQADDFWPDVNVSATLADGACVHQGGSNGGERPPGWAQLIDPWRSDNSQQLVVAPTSDFKRSAAFLLRQGTQFPSQTSCFSL